jgi:hypothetical protein
MRLPRQVAVRIQVGTRRVIAAVLAVSAADAGFWAERAPRSVYNSFPLDGHHWVSMLGPATST